MPEWKNLDTLKTYETLKSLKGKVDIVKELSGPDAASRVEKYIVPMAADLSYSFAAKQVDDDGCGHVAHGLLGAVVLAQRNGNAPLLSKEAFPMQSIRRRPRSLRRGHR